MATLNELHDFVLLKDSIETDVKWKEDPIYETHAYGWETVRWEDSEVELVSSEEGFLYWLTEFFTKDTPLSDEDATQVTEFCKSSDLDYYIIDENLILRAMELAGV